MWLFHFDLTL